MIAGRADLAGGPRRRAARVRAGGRPRVCVRVMSVCVVVIYTCVCVVVIYTYVCEKNRESNAMVCVCVRARLHPGPGPIAALKLR